MLTQLGDCHRKTFCLAMIQGLPEESMVKRSADSELNRFQFFELGFHLSTLEPLFALLQSSLYRELSGPKAMLSAQLRILTHSSPFFFHQILSLFAVKAGLPLLSTARLLLAPAGYLTGCHLFSTDFAMRLAPSSCLPSVIM